ncbi:retropepsin-like aspartic protease [Massilia genomosp. 1]|uniref:Uncharacterized protein n=1 Tax=Massilia genomosp. 1 TaxID=2609280 RepID=A0ABX0MRF9_9BURK|nr:retropepsin-like aspartic protease [Massilia genomosp. 1]NHZ65333.1 hypothetical protein [Massilia genomosp. 1]
MKAFIVLAALILPSLAGAACTLAKTTTLPIQYSGSTMVAPAVRGSINGTPAAMWLHTGTASTLLTRTAAEKNQLTVGAGTPGRAKLTSFNVGPINGAVTLPVVSDNGYPPGFDGVLGADVLMQADLEVALGEKEMRIGCTPPGWAARAVKLPMLTRPSVDKRVRVTVKVNGMDLEAQFDSNAPHSSITDDGAAKAGVKTTAPEGPWSALFATIAVGPDSVKNVDLPVRATYGSNAGEPDVVLGSDFFRAYKIYFANSERQVYLSRSGSGEVFAKPAASPPSWLLKEGESGNADAQLALANYRYADWKVGRAWLEKAANQGQQRALIELARIYRREKKAAEMVPRLRKAPVTPRIALELFLTQTAAGDKEGARRDLAAANIKGWPAPIADFYLGRLKMDPMYDQAEAFPALGKARLCEVHIYTAQLSEAQGNHHHARQMMEAWQRDCGTF